jgi:CubicO group peptidase (beta-lactamase class C family)
MEVTMKSISFSMARSHIIRTAASAVLLVLALPVDAQTKHRVSSGFDSTSLGSTVDACVQTAIAAYDIPGLAVAVVADGQIAYERGFGVRHRAQGGAVDEHTLFRPGSVDKMFTAAAILRLVDQGAVRLDDRVTDYVPELHFAPGRWNADQIRVRHLIENSAAIPSFRTLPDGSLSDWVGTLDEIPLLAKPGAFFNYSNSNFALADLVVERASGMALGDYMVAEIYRLAGMADSTGNGSEATATGNYSFGHADDGTIYAPDDYRHIFDGFMSAHDIARWVQIMMNGGEDVLSLKSAHMAQTPQVPLLFYPGHPTGTNGGSYGFGVFIEDFPAGRVLRHSGGIPGWVAQVAWVPTEGFAVVMLANSWPNAFGGVQNAMECVLEGAIGFSMPDMSEPSDPRWWRYFAGTYDAVFENGFEFEVVVEFRNGELLMTAPKLEDSTQSITRVLENVHASSFIYRPEPNSSWEITFVPEIGRRPIVKWLRNLRFVGYRSASPRSVARRVED